jgi:hypothetical protein
MNEWMQRVLESKRVMRTRLASLSFTEKLALLEKLRERHISIASSGLRRRPTSEGAARPVEHGG